MKKQLEYAMGKIFAHFTTWCLHMKIKTTKETHYLL